MSAKSASSNPGSVLSYIGSRHLSQVPQGPRPPQTSFSPERLSLRQKSEKPGFIIWITWAPPHCSRMICIPMTVTFTRVSSRVFLVITVASSLIPSFLWVYIDAGRPLCRRWTQDPDGPQAPIVQEWSISSSLVISPPERACAAWSCTAIWVRSNKESVQCPHSGFLLTIQMYGSQDQFDSPFMICS